MTLKILQASSQMHLMRTVNLYQAAFLEAATAMQAQVTAKTRSQRPCQTKQEVRWNGKQAVQGLSVFFIMQAIYYGAVCELGCAYVMVPASKIDSLSQNLICFTEGTALGGLK